MAVTAAAMLLAACTGQGSPAHRPATSSPAKVTASPTRALPDPASLVGDVVGLQELYATSGSGPATLRLPPIARTVRVLTVRWACTDGPMLGFGFNSGVLASGPCDGSVVVGAAVPLKTAPPDVLHIVTGPTTKWRLAVFNPYTA